MALAPVLEEAKSKQRIKEKTANLKIEKKAMRHPCDAKTLDTQLLEEMDCRSHGSLSQETLRLGGDASPNKEAADGEAPPELAPPESAPEPAPPTTALDSS